jgi:hypothetical protein
MSLVVDLDPRTEEALKKKAAVKGTPVDSYVKGLIEADVTLSYEEVMAPVWKDFEDSDMSEDEFDGFVESLRDKVWHGKHGG